MPGRISKSLAQQIRISIENIAGFRIAIGQQVRELRRRRLAEDKAVDGKRSAGFGRELRDQFAIRSLSILSVKPVVAAIWIQFPASRWLIADSSSVTSALQFVCSNLTGYPFQRVRTRH